MTPEILAELSRIRKAMVAALREKPKNIALYHRLADQHRCTLHAANPAMKAAWEGCHMQTYGKVPG
jgi:hypothetical protein